MTEKKYVECDGSRCFVKGVSAMKLFDQDIELVWVVDPESDTECRDDVRVNPDFFQNNGTPIDDVGEDMLYSHTDVKLPMQKVLIEVRGGVAYVTKCPKNITVEIRDHDNR